jgi:hypothetical protein
VDDPFGFVDPTCAAQKRSVFNVDVLPRFQAGGAPVSIEVGRRAVDVNPMDDDLREKREEHEAAEKGHDPARSAGGIWSRHAISWSN